MIQLLALILFGLVAIWFALRVFMTKSMVRSAFSLLGTMAAIGALMLTMEAEFLGVLQLMMMAGEMAIMAIFMMMYMMDPGGMEGMDMTHQKRPSLAVAVISGVLVLAVVFLAPWPESVANAPDSFVQVHDLGIEIMERSMIIFQTAGISILTSMIVSTLLALPRKETA